MLRHSIFHVIRSSHDLSFLYKLCRRISCCKHGQWFDDMPQSERSSRAQPLEAWLQGDLVRETNPSPKKKKKAYRGTHTVYFLYTL